MTPPALLNRAPGDPRQRAVARLRCIFLGVALALGCASVAAQAGAIANAESSAPATGQTLHGQALLKALQVGGLVIYFRHTATDFSRNDAAMQGYADCANQRLLSAQGREDATRLGRDIRGLDLRIIGASEVLASPMCRTMEHAKLMFGRATPTPELREGRGGDYPELKRLLTAPVAKGRNRWIVGHGNPFRAVAGPPHLAEGEAVIIRPGSTRWTVLARLSVDQWAGLAPR